MKKVEVNFEKEIKEKIIECQDNLDFYNNNIEKCEDELKRLYQRKEIFYKKQEAYMDALNLYKEEKGKK